MMAEPETLSLADQYDQRVLLAAYNAAAGVATMALGDADEPYTIISAGQLAELATYVNNVDNKYPEYHEAFYKAYFALAQDIDLSEYAFVYAEGNNGYEILSAGWTPIGNEDNPFCGNFDGKGHAITGMSITSDGGYLGLFGNVNGGTITGCNVAGTVSSISDDSKFIAGVAGCIIDTSITGCSFTGTVSGATNVGGIAGSSVNSLIGACCVNAGSISAKGSVGGIVGLVFGSDADRYIYACYANANVSASGVGAEDAGGIAGCMRENSIINCHFAGSVRNSNMKAGGIVGTLSNSTIDSCYAVGTVETSYGAGGIAGLVTSSDESTPAAIINCVALNQSVTSGNTYYGAIYGHKYLDAGGNYKVEVKNSYYWQGMSITGNGEHIEGGTDCAAPITYNGSKLQAGGADFTWPLDTDAWANVSAETLPTLIGVDGQSSAMPGYIRASDETLITEINNADDLAAFADTVNSDNDYTGQTVTLNADIDMAGIAWTAIGSYASGKAFSGTFDGAGHVITNLEAQNSNGLFETVSGATIKNLGLKDASITGASSTNGTGGIIGHATASSTIQNCYYVGTVEGGKYAGGIVGLAEENCTITDCYTSGNVNALSIPAYAGGIVGSSDGTISSCYSVAAVYVNALKDYDKDELSAIGGIVGDNTSGAVTVCVALNEQVTVGSKRNETEEQLKEHVGAICGNASNDKTDCYYWGSMSIEGPSGESIENNNGATAITYTDGKLQSNNADFTWASLSGNNSWENTTAETLPTLAGINGQSSTLPRFITSELITKIYTAADLAAFATAVNSGTSYSGVTVTLENDIDLTDLYGWTPIGKIGTVNNAYFSGIFDGQGHKITGFTIYGNQNNTAAGTSDYQALFGVVQGYGDAEENTAIIKNLGMENVNIAGGDRVGGIVAYLGSNARVINCYCTGTLSGKNRVGGIVGYASGGENAPSSVTNCHFAGTVTASEANAGGIVGFNAVDGSVSNCYSTGAVNGVKFTGGITGRNRGSISSCYSTASITATGDFTGGISAGCEDDNESQNNSITNCVALNESITADGSVGVVAAESEYTKASGCYYLNDMAITKTDGTAVETKDSYNSSPLCVVKGTLCNMDGNCVFSWNGFDEAAWTMPGKTEAELLALPYITGTTPANYPALRLENYRVVNTLADAVVTLNKTSFTYNGKQQTPNVMVTLYGQALTEGEDYTATPPDDATNAGTVTITVAGKGLFTDTKTATYTIAPAKATVSYTGAITKVYDGSTAATGIAAKLTGVNGEAFTVTGLTGTYAAANAANSIAVKNISDSKASYTAAGGAKKANYTITYPNTTGAITAKTVTVTVGKIPDQTYTGSQIKPSVTVSGVAAGQYTVTYGTNTAVGTGTVKVSPVAGSNYTFTPVTATFAITAAPTATPATPTATPATPTATPATPTATPTTPPEPTATPATPTPTPTADGRTGVEKFVDRLYSVCLGRNADAEGRADWVSRLTSYQISGTKAAFGFVFSEEFTNKNYSNADFVEHLYEAFMGRASDEGGKADWVGQLDAGAAREEVFAGFANSVEFDGICKSYGIVSKDIETFVTRLYSVCLDRQPDEAGLADWAGRLRSGEISGKATASGFVFSEEFTSKNYSNADYVEHLYAAFMGRASDEGGKADWVSKLDAGTTREEVFNGFADSAEFDNICASYGIARG